MSLGKIIMKNSKIGKKCVYGVIYKYKYREDMERQIFHDNIT